MHDPLSLDILDNGSKRYRFIAISNHNFYFLFCWRKRESEFVSTFITTALLCTYYHRSSTTLTPQNRWIKKFNSFGHASKIQDQRKCATQKSRPRINLCKIKAMSIPTISRSKCVVIQPFENHHEKVSLFTQEKRDYFSGVTIYLNLWR